MRCIYGNWIRSGLLLGCALLLLAQANGADAPSELQPVSPQKLEELKALRFTVDDFPRINGSQITQPLSTLAACELTGTEGKWEIDPHRKIRLYFPLEPRKNVVKKPGQKSIPLTIHSKLDRKTYHHGTHRSYVNLIKGKADLLLVARPPNAEETQLAEDKGVKIELKPIAKDALTIMVHSDNKVRSVTTEQLHGIYTGKITNWQELGGKDKMIQPLRQSTSSSAQQIMEELVMQGDEMAVTRGLNGSRMRGSENVLTHSPDGIAFTSYYYIRFMAASMVTKPCAVDGVLPYHDTIQNDKYPHITRIYLASRSDLPADSKAGALRDWLLSPLGQALVAKSGLVPLDAKQAEKAPAK